MTALASVWLFFFFLLRVREEDPLSLGRRRRPSWAGSSSYFSCPCVGKHRDIPTGEKERRKIERVSPHRAPVSSLSPLGCLNNHKNLHTVHRNGLKEKVDQENKTKHRKKKTDHIKTLKHPTRKKPIAKKKSAHPSVVQWEIYESSFFFYVFDDAAGTEW